MRLSDQLVRSMCVAKSFRDDTQNGSRYVHKTPQYVTPPYCLNVHSLFEACCDNYHLSKWFLFSNGMQPAGGQGKIQSLNFSLDGENLITCSDDDTIVIYDCQKG